MSVEANANDHRHQSPRRKVAIRPDGDDFVVVFQPDNLIALRNLDPNALRKACTYLRWEVIDEWSLTARFQL
jgi:hypothetical protein